MSPDTSWSKRRSCMTDADLCEASQVGLEPPWPETLEYPCLKLLSSISGPSGTA